MFIKLFNTSDISVRQWCLNEFVSSSSARKVACSFCMQSAILSALIRSSYTRGSTTAAAAATAAKTRQAGAVAATTSGASESATAAAATTSDDCCQVCIVAPRAGFALVQRGHRTRRQYTRGRNDDKENLEINLSVNHTINHYFIVRPNVVQRAGHLSLPHVGIS